MGRYLFYILQSKNCRELIDAYIYYNRKKSFSPIYIYMCSKNILQKNGRSNNAIFQLNTNKI